MPCALNRVIEAASPWPACGSGSIRVDGAGGVTTLRGVDQDRRVEPLGQVVSQVHAPDAVVGDPHPFGERLAGQPPGHLDAEAVVGQEDVAQAGDERAAGGFAHVRHRVPASDATVSSHSVWYTVVWASWIRCTEDDGATNR